MTEGSSTESPSTVPSAPMTVILLPIPWPMSLIKASISPVVLPAKCGSLAEEIALAGKFYVPEEQKVKDPGQEQLLLHATVEELVLHDLALQIAGVGGNPKARSVLLGPQAGGREIAQRLAEARAGFR